MYGTEMWVQALLDAHTHVCISVVKYAIFYLQQGTNLNSIPFTDKISKLVWKFLQDKKILGPCQWCPLKHTTHSSSVLIMNLHIWVLHVRCISLVTSSDTFVVCLCITHMRCPKQTQRMRELLFWRIMPHLTSLMTMTLMFFRRALLIGISIGHKSFSPCV